LINRKHLACSNELSSISLDISNNWEIILPKEKIKGLISDLHEKLSDSQSSPQQDLLLAQLQAQLDSWEGPKPANGDFKDATEELLEELEERHPKAARIALEILESLGHLGL
jgi:hypothetical protein